MVVGEVIVTITVNGKQRIKAQKIDNGVGDSMILLRDTDRETERETFRVRKSGICLLGKFQKKQKRNYYF